MPAGGKREGSGRKRKSEKFKGSIARAERRFADRLPEVAEKILELAAGIWVEQEFASGARIVYRTPPDLKACLAVLDRIMGRPVQALEHSGEDGGPLKIVVEYADDPAQAPEAARGPGEDPPEDGEV